MCYGIGLIPVIGVLAAMGMVLHAFSDGIIRYVLQLGCSFRERSATVIALFAAALSTSPGTVVSWPRISRIDAPLLVAPRRCSRRGAGLHAGATRPAAAGAARGGLPQSARPGAGILIALVIVRAG